MRAARKEVGEVLDRAIEAGFTFERYTGSGHYQLRHENGNRLVIPSTPSGPRWKRNALADIKRAQRREAI